MLPTIGRVVIYRSRTGQYDVPAIVNATRETLWEVGVERGDVPALSSETHVHLTVFTPGEPEAGPNATKPGRIARKPPAGASSVNLAGTYQEWDIGQATDPENPEPGTWRWPERVS